jgi:membrane protein
MTSRRSPDAPTADRGAEATSPGKIPKRGWKEVLVRVWGEIDKDNISIVAAGCAFYAMLALFPGITALISVYGLVADPTTVEQQLGALEGMLPAEAFSLIQNQAHSVASTGATALSWGAALGIGLALWSTSAGVRTVFTALNIAYEEKETRGFLHYYGMALLFTLASVLAVIVGLAVIVALPPILEALPLGPLAGIVIQGVTWLLMLAMVTVGIGLLYRYGPSRAPANWRWLSPGSIAATLMWVAASLLFSFYAANFTDYNETYGALGGVIILLMWLWLTSFAVLMGAELNAELELQTRKDTTTGPERPMGKRDAFVADHTAEARS